MKQALIKFIITVLIVSLFCYISKLCYMPETHSPIILMWIGIAICLFRMWRYKRKIHSEKTIVRQNMMDNKNYKPYCGNIYGCGMPRLNSSFVCPECNWKPEFDPEFFKRYKKKHRIK